MNFNDQQLVTNKPLFSEIDLFEDTQEEDGFLQMAIDEVLVHRIKKPLLRHYRWKGAWVSFGYFQKWHEIQQAFPNRPLVRRWSGGGAVDHAQDWTFSLIIPSTDPFRRLPADLSYCEIHSRLKIALSCFFEGVRIVTQAEERMGAQCFFSPRHNDLCWNGLKVAGGAQRRCFSGLLHQGSIQYLALPPSFASAFASYLAPQVNLFLSSNPIRDEAVKVSFKRYKTREWLKKM